MTRRKSSHAVREAARSVIEPLEGRRYLSTINWTNKGTGAGAGDTDSFNAIYGANATTARNIVQRAIDDWEKVIVDFNYAGGGNTYDVTVTAAPVGGRGATTGITNNAGKPDSADITLDDNGGGAGWYFDPVIGSAAVPDDSEFTTLVTPFMATFTGSGGGNDDDDLYRTIVHELGHAMGIAGGGALLLDDNFTDIGDDPISSDPADRLFAWNINGGAVEATFTNAGGIHFYEGPTPPVGGTAHPNELLNSGRTVGAPPTTRQLISDLIATVLRDAYGYTIKLPSTINTFYANLNTTTNQVIVSGDIDPTGDLNDNIDLEVTDSLTAMSFEANGTDEIIEGAEFTSILVNAGEGGDDIDVDELLASKFVTVNGDAGNDIIQIAPEFGDVGNNLLSDVITDGGIGTDTLTFNDTNDPVGNDNYTFFSPTVACGSHITVHSGMERLEMTSSREASIFNINGTGSAYSLDIVASGFSDTFNIGDDDYDTLIGGDISIDGLVGTDVVNINDGNDTGADTYTLSPFSFSKASGGGTLSLDSVESFTINANGDANLFNVDLLNSTMAATVNAGAGNDTLDVDGASNDLDNGLLANLVFNGQAGMADFVELNDSGDSADAETYSLSGFEFSKSSAGGVLSMNGTEQIHLTGNGGANTITVEFGNIFLGQSVTVGGGGGNDTITSLVPGTVSLMEGNITLQGGAGTDTIVLDDSAGSIADQYTLTADTFVSSGVVPVPGTINYTAEVFDLTTSSFPANHRVEGSSAATDYTLRGGLGDDTFTFGGPGRDVSGLLGDVEIFGGGGSDRLQYNDDNFASDAGYRVSTNNFGRDGVGNVAPRELEVLVLNAGTGADDIRVSDTFATATTTVNGGQGNDTLRAATGLWDTGIQGPVTVNGNNGTDVVIVDDTADVGNDNYAITAAQITKNAAFAAPISYNTAEELRLQANGGNNTVNVNSTFVGTVSVAGNGGTDSINVVDHAIGATVIVDGGALLDNVSVNADNAGTATAQFNVSQDLNLLTIGTGGTARLNTGGLLLDVQNAVSQGTLDLTDGGFIDRGGTAIINAYATQLTNGHNGGAWNGAAPAILSSTAAGSILNDGVGYAGAGTIGVVTFLGVAVAANDLLLRYTLNGDTNLNQSVGIGDFANLAANFNVAGTRWSQGNFNYDATTDIADFAALAGNFNQALPRPEAPPAARAARGIFSDERIMEEIVA